MPSRLGDLRPGVLAAAMAALLAGPPTPEARAQGGGPPGGGAGRDAPRGVGVPLEESTEPGGESGFGGTTGGRGRDEGTLGSASRGQLPDAPGDPAASLLGAPIGASGAAGFELVPGNQRGLLFGRLSPLAVPASDPGAAQPGGGGDQRQRLRRDRLEVRPPGSDPITLAPGARLEVPTGPEDPGPPDGLSLDDAIALLIRRNLDLIALRYEVPKAQADILTAGLRNNPILYADAQLIPYGHYSYLRPGGGGGQPQYNVNISYPLDLTRKRRARLAVAERAGEVTQAQLQDAVRGLIDDLYRAYVNALAARETLRFTEAALDGLTRIRDQADRERDRLRDEADSARAEHGDDSDEARSAGDRAQAADEAAENLEDQVRQARFQVRRAGQVLARTRRELAILLDLPPAQAESIRLRGTLRQLVDLPAPPDEIVRVALDARPDLAAYRLGLERAQAEVRLARANRYSDVYLVYQPYTLQAGRAFGHRATYSYALGVNASLPLYNRNQGNIARAESTVHQTRVQFEALQLRVAHEVEEAIRDFEISQAAVLEMERAVLPASRRARDLAFAQYRRDPSKVNDYIDKQKDYHDVVQEYRNALIDHRQSTLDLNTAAGLRLLP